MKIDPEIAHVRAVGAAETMWSNVVDRTARTAPARQGFLDKLKREARERLGPAATDEQVAKAADSALKAHYARMRLRSLQSRRKAAQEKRDQLADAILSESAADESERGADDTAA